MGLRVRQSSITGASASQDQNSLILRPPEYIPFLNSNSTDSERRICTGSKINRISSGKGLQDLESLQITHSFSRHTLDNYPLLVGTPTYLIPLCLPIMVRPRKRSPFQSPQQALLLLKNNLSPRLGAAVYPPAIDEPTTLRTHKAQLYPGKTKYCYQPSRSNARYSQPLKSSPLYKESSLYALL